MVDVALASRSVATADLRDSLLRLTDVARRRVCVTLATGSSPRTDERILNAMGLSSVLGRDYLYAFNILANEGLRPEVSYIDSERTDTFDSLDDAYDAFARMADDAVGATVGAEERAEAFGRLRCWLEENLVPNERAGQPDKKGLPEKSLRPARAPNGHLGVHRLEQVERVPNGRSPFGTVSNRRLTTRCARTCRDPRCTRGR